MKKAVTSIFMLFGVLAGLLISSVSAQATVPPSNCANQGGLVNVVVCEIDADDNGVLNGNDIKVIIQKNNVLSNNDLDVLVHALDDADVDIDDVVTIKDIVVNVYDLIDIDLDPTVIVVLPCGCSH